MCLPLGRDECSIDQMVLSKGFGEDQDVHVTDGHALADEVREDVIHFFLECGWGVAKAEENHLGFIQPLFCGKCSLPPVSFLDLDIVETPLEVQSTPFKLDMGQHSWMGIEPNKPSNVEAADAFSQRTSQIQEEAKATLEHVVNEVKHCYTQSWQDAPKYKE